MEANKVGPTWVVGPSEDVLQALMEALVYPLLPLGVSDVPPSEDDHKSVAKQMHAVVLLYNYQYRKHKPELVFLDFVSFCKLTVVIKPTLISFMKLTVESEPMKSNIAENHLSVTEKAIKDACDIAVALDASRDFPNTDGWPISKVAVLLIDSKKEDCMLQRKIGYKRKRSSLKASTYDTEFLQLAYDAVKDFNGICSSDLEVLETHVTYSLGKEKSATRFYMMQYAGSFSVNETVPLKYLVESLQGPVAEKLDCGSWKTTPVVEFYHMLPYVEFISCWLSGEDLCLPSLNGRIAQSTMNGCKKELTQSRTSSLPVPIYNGNDLDHSDNNSMRIKVNSSDKIANENCDDNKCKNSSGGNINLEISDTDSEKTVIDDNVIDKLNKKHDIANSAEREESLTYCEILDKDGDKCEKDSLSGPLSGLKTMNTSDLTKTCTKSEDTSKKLNSKIRVYHHRRKNNLSTQNDALVREDGGNLKSNNCELMKSGEYVGLLKSHNAQRRDDKVVSENKGDVTISCDQNVIDAASNQLVQFEAKTKSDIKLQSVSASEELQNALSLLYRKRQELHSQISKMEDTLALYENDITRIRDGKFVSNVIVQGKDCDLHSKGGSESKPYEARESAAAQMIAKIRNSLSNTIQLIN
ncbi:hypothetical protein DH2020_023079 [Rehmannia glutinosa]|uniref:Uncharacterized protein n=1 Tax=Rehmannia glutinosa TaxID=99300 RepID=A0ABR0W500_REHGL